MKQNHSQGNKTKIALITGASSGIGQGAAIALADKGIPSIITYNQHEDRVQETIAEVERRNVKAIPLKLDVGKSETFPQFRKELLSVLKKEWQTDRLDYLVNNAGFGKMVYFQETTEELFEQFFRVLLKGPYFLTQQLLDLIPDGGAIINTTSNSAMVSGRQKGYSAYASMKGGLITLTQYMAMEFAQRKIRVNAVSPGPTRTRIAEDAFEKYPEVIPPIVEKTALGRLGDGYDVGLVIASVLSDEFRWVTGQNIEASGGWNM